MTSHDAPPPAPPSVPAGVSEPLSSSPSAATPIRPALRLVSARGLDLVLFCWLLVASGVALVAHLRILLRYGESLIPRYPWLEPSSVILRRFLDLLPW